MSISGRLLVGALLVLGEAACSGDVTVNSGASGGQGGAAVTVSGVTVSSAPPSVSASSGSGGGSCNGAAVSGDECIPLCPSVEPVVGNPCDIAQQQCEFSDELELECRRNLLCDPSTCLWSLGEMPSSCGPTSMTACPPSAAAGTCDVAQACHFDDGSLCWCAPGGLSCAEGPPPTAPCPEVAPRLGSPCATEGSNCIYGFCAPNVEGARQCCGGVWGRGFITTIPC